MHRSGTSCLAGALEQCGLYLGEVRRSGVHNAKGYFEIKSIQQVHDQILGLNRGYWHVPPQKVSVHPHYHQVFASIDAELSKHRPCGLKDPRLLLLLDAWVDNIKKPHGLVGTFRHPLAVAHSLNYRNGLPLEQGISLWLNYNQRLVNLHQANPFPLIEYSLAETDKYIQSIALAAEQLALRPNIRQLRRFITSSLEHYSSFESIPKQCKTVYDYLQYHVIS